MGKEDGRGTFAGGPAHEDVARRPAAGVAVDGRLGADAATVPPAGPTRPDGQAAEPAPAPEMRVGRTRTSSLFAAATVGLLLALLMLVFVLQNGDSQEFDFLWMEFRLPTGTAMLLAAVIGGLVVGLLGLGRVLQLRMAARRHRRSDQRSLAQR